MREIQLKLFKLDRIFDRNAPIAIVLYKDFIFEKNVELQKRTQESRSRVDFDKIYKHKKIKKFFDKIIETINFKLSYQRIFVLIEIDINHEYITKIKL